MLAQSPAEHLVIYPRIVPFTSVEIPSHSPQGTLRHHLPLFEDPTRVFGKRGYLSGDSLRRIDWKASASSGRLQVKLFEPSIALETFIVLNLNAEDYYYRTRIDSTELAIVIAASVSNWIVGKKQMVGMMVNGRDPLADDGRPQTNPPRKGKASHDAPAGNTGAGGNGRSVGAGSHFCSNNDTGWPGAPP